MTAESEATTCEHIVAWAWDRPPRPVFCGKLAVRRYPAMAGGYMHMCIEHAKGHEAWSELCYEGEAR